jgi:Zn-dependent protease
LSDAAPLKTTAAKPPAALSFSLLGFPVRVRVEFLIIIALLGSMGGDASSAQIAAWVAVCFVSVLFHELGHAIVARRAGYRPWIELYGMGGLTHCERSESTPPPTWRTDLAIAVAGPFFGLALGGAVWLANRNMTALHDQQLAREVVWDLLWVNVGWSVLNLVPILPYDGGLAAMAVLGRLFPGRGGRMAYQLTVVVSVLALAGSIYARWVWTGYLAARALFGALRVLRFDGSIGKAWELWDALRFAEAQKEAERAGTRALDVFGRARATELVVFACLASKDAAGAKAAYESFPEQVLPSPLLRAIVALDTDDHAKAAELLRVVPPMLVARVVLPILVAWATSGWEDRAMAWLDEETFAALPKEATVALGEVLHDRGCRELSGRVEELRRLTTPHLDLSSPASR